MCKRFVLFAPYTHIRAKNKKNFEVPNFRKKGVLVSRNFQIKQQKRSPQPGQRPQQIEVKKYLNHFKCTQNWLKYAIYLTPCIIYRWAEPTPTGIYTWKTHEKLIITRYKLVSVCTI